MGAKEEEVEFEATGGAGSTPPVSQQVSGGSATDVMKKLCSAADESSRDGMEEVVGLVGASRLRNGRGGG